jgi:Putative prokaryotic signal transducing protein
MAADPTPDPKPNEKLVRVFDTEQETEALVVKGLLESAGIDSKISGIDTVQDVLPIGGTIILVREEDEPAARQLLEEYRRSPAQEAAEEEDFDTTAETATAEDGPSSSFNSSEDPQAE